MRRPLLRIILVLVVLLGLAFLAYLFVFKNEAKENDPSLISPVSENESGLDNAPPRRKSRLPQILDEEIDKSTAFHAVYIKNLKTGEMYQKNENEKFEAASLYKLWVMGEAYNQIKDGALKKEEIMHDEIAKLNERFDISSESAELKEGEITLSVEQALEEMITVSDNYAALLLSSRIRLSNVAQFLKDHGFVNSSIGVPPTTTALDTGLFFEKLYNGEIVDEFYSREMLELLKRQQINDRIPYYLPQDVKVAHKTGELGEVKHDAGIVFGAGGDYIFVWLSRSSNPALAADEIAQFSKKVYDYFSSQ